VPVKKISKISCLSPLVVIELILPPAARGALFEKTVPLDPQKKLLIIGKKWFCLNIFNKTRVLVI